MVTSNATVKHPFDLLEAFAMDSLEAAEEQDVADHIEWCQACFDIVEENLRALTVLAETAPQVSPPAGLRARVLDSTDSSPRESERVSVSVPPPARSWSRVTWVSGSRWFRFATPITAVIAVIAVAAAVVLNIQAAGRVNEAQSENTVLRQQLDQSLATTTALARSSITVSQDQGNLQQWQETSYALAQPGNQTLVLSPASPGIESRGVVVLSEDGTDAIVMASNLSALSLDSVFHVWLTKDGQWYWAGELEVDDRGWGTMPMTSPESLLQYDTLQISRGIAAAAALAAPAGSAERAQATGSMVGDMVLTAELR